MVDPKTADASEVPTCIKELMKLFLPFHVVSQYVSTGLVCITIMREYRDRQHDGLNKEEAIEIERCSNRETPRENQRERQWWHGHIATQRGRQTTMLIPTFIGTQVLE